MTIIEAQKQTSRPVLDGIDKKITDEFPVDFHAQRETPFSSYSNTFRQYENSIGYEFYEIST